MEFSSLFFLWTALPVICLLAALVRRTKPQNLLLLVISLLFYAWGDPGHLVVLLVLIAANYVFGLAMDRLKAQKTGSGVPAARDIGKGAVQQAAETAARSGGKGAVLPAAVSGGHPAECVIFVLAVVFDLGALSVFKYADFFLATLDRVIPGTLPRTGIVQPIGISFFTFQALSYVIDLHRGKFRAQRDPVKLALYLSFFPRILSGPIETYAHAEPQLDARRMNRADFAEGFRRFLYGLGKKVILSDLAAVSVDRIFAQTAQLNGPAAWIGVSLYALQLYYDFSGYSDMAIGLGRMLGFTIPENFRYPYLSGSVSEFWRRWHITLGAWFRDYLYIPLGGNRGGTRKTVRNLLIVFALTGLWHGASWTFVLWGLWHGLFIVLERLGLRKFLDRHRVIGVLYTDLVWVISMALFRAGSFSEAWLTLKCMFIPAYFTGAAAGAQPLIASFFTVQTLGAVILGILGCGILQELLPGGAGISNVRIRTDVSAEGTAVRKAERQKSDPRAERPGFGAGSAKRWRGSAAEAVYLALVFACCVLLLAGNTYHAFIYARF